MKYEYYIVDYIYICTCENEKVSVKCKSSFNDRILSQQNNNEKIASEVYSCNVVLCLMTIIVVINVTAFYFSFCLRI